MNQPIVGTDYTFVRKLVAGSVDLVGLGPLNLAVPRGYRRRQIYAAVVWQGWQDWLVEGSLEMVSGGSALETFRTRWGTTYDGLSGSSQTTWGAADNGSGWRMSTSGWPMFSVATYLPANYPNGIPSLPAAPDAIRFQTLNRPNGTTPEMADVVMHPMTFIGNIETVRFQFTRRTVTTVESSPTVEVYLGCRTFN
jgi:hypothetical protein